MREALGRSAKRFAHENFTIERMRNKHEDLYAELLERKGWSSKSSPARVRRASGYRPLRVTIVAASLRYVGGQSVQADLLLKHWQNDPDVHGRTSYPSILPSRLVSSGRKRFRACEHLCASLYMCLHFGAD